MQIYVNNEVLHTDCKNLQELIDLQAVGTQRIAAALNGSIIVRRDWPETQLNNDDDIEFFQAVSGG